MSAQTRPGDEPVAMPTGRGQQVGGLGGVDAATLAAATSTSRFDHAGAALHLTRAVEIVVAAGQAGSDTHFELLHALGRAHWRAGARIAAASTFDEAWRIAVDADDADQMARAALGGGFICDFSGDVAVARAERCRAALQRLPDGDSSTKARLLADLASSLVVDADHRAAREAASEALAMARRTGHPLSIGYALLAGQFLQQGPANLHERVEGSRTIIELAGETGEHALEVLGRFCLIGALLEAADPAVIDEIAIESAIIRRLREPGYHRHDLWFRCTLAILDGDLTQAEHLAAAGFDAAVAANDPDAFAVYGGQLDVIRWMQGRADETAGSLELMLKEQPDTPLWPAVLATVHALTGDHDGARDLLGAVDPATVPDDRHTLLTLAAIGETAAIVGDREKLDATATALAPYAARMIPIAMGAATWGPVARQLGLIALGQGDAAAAADHFRTAIEVARRVGAAPWITWCTIDLLETEHRLGTIDDASRDTLQQVVADATSVGMRHVATRATALLGRLG